MKKHFVKQRLLFPIKKMTLFQIIVMLTLFNVKAGNINRNLKIAHLIEIKAIRLLDVNVLPPVIKGKVVDEKGNPLPGATVLAKGTKIAAITDVEGNFVIDLPRHCTRIVVSYIGMESQELSIDKLPALIVLNTIGENLKEVVVTTGYEKTSKRTFTGATSRITEQDLKVDGVTDISRMIEGKAAGVSVQNVTGSFGTAPKITVRGASSILGDAKPLWVIDGIVQEDIVNFSLTDLASGNSSTLLSSSIAGLNPNDVLSIEVLKDASATSIYGTRSMNGVVVVTTKQGRRESPLRVTYSVEQTIRTVPSYSQYDILDSQESMGIFKELESKGFLGVPDILQGRDGGVYSILGRSINTYSENENAFGVKNNMTSRKSFLKKYEMANTNWFKTLFRSSMMQNHSLSFSGGGKSNTYYASLGYLSDPGWTLADKVNQVAINLKTTFFVNDKLSLAISAQASIRDQNAPGSYEASQDSYSGATNRIFDINPFSYVLSTNRTLRPYDYNGTYEYYRKNWAPMNIIEELENNYMKIKVNDIRFQVDLAYKINRNLSYNLVANARYAHTTREHNIMESSNVVAAYNADENTVVRNANNFLYQDPENLTALRIPVLENGGILRKFSDDLTSFNVRNSFTFKKRVNDKHELEAFLGQELRVVDRKKDNFTAFGLQYTRGLEPFTNPKLLKKTIDEGGKYFELGLGKERTVGFFGKVGYTYDRRYTVSVTGRFDGSNEGGSLWLPTYTFSGKWNAKEESFLQENNTISNLSFRASYGLTATAAPVDNALPVYKSTITDRLKFGDRESGLNIEALQNTDLTWEKQFSTNVGMDLGLFENKIQLTADIYRNKAFDLVDLMITPGIGGSKFKFGNNASMTTKGIDLSITTNNLNTKFKWSTSFNFSIFNQEITKFVSPASALTLIQGRTSTLGHPRTALYSYQFQGLNNRGLPTFVMADGETDNVSGANFNDYVNPVKYLKYEGPGEANKSAGLSNTFTYENWSLNIFIVASGGNVVRLNPIYSDQYNDLTVFTKDFKDRWMMAGDEMKTNVPVIADKRLIANYAAESKVLSKAYNAFNYSNQRIADGSFVRLKNISISYEFPKDLKKKLKVDVFTLKGSTANPMLLYSDKKLNGQDPEFSRTGGVALPIASQYTFAINVSF